MDHTQAILDKIKEKKKSKRFFTEKIIDACITEYEVSQRKEKDSSRSYYVGKITFHDGDIRDATFMEFKNSEEKSEENSEETVVKSIFSHTSRLINPSILKPWFFTYCEGTNSWLVCYDRFEHILKDWLLSEKNNKKPFGAPHQLLDPWWSNNIRKLLKATNDIHRRKLLHMGLKDTENYVIVNNVVKIINVRSSFRKLNSTQDPNILVAKDFKEFREMLKEVLEFSPNPTLLLEVRAEAERDLFLSLFDKYNDVVYKKLLKHPFLMSANERMQYFFTIHHCVETDTIPAARTFILAVNKLEEFEKWTSWTRTPELERVYVNPKTTYKDDVCDLLRFLRNVYTHYKETKPLRQGMEPVIVSIDKAVTKLYPNFLVKIHELIPIDILSDGWID